MGQPTPASESILPLEGILPFRVGPPVRIHRGRYSTSELRETGEGRRVFVKRYLPGPRRAAPESRAKREFAAAEHLHAHRARVGFRIPEPIFVSSELPLAVFGEVGGEQLDRRITKILRRSWHVRAARRLTGAMAAVGEALARLASVPAPPWAAEPDAGALDDPRRALIWWIDSGRVPPAALEALVERLDASPPPGEPRSCAHHDLGFWNVLWDGGTPGLVDLELLAPGPRLGDLAQAFLHLDWLRSAAAARPRRIAACRRRLLGGFGGIREEELPEWRRLRVAGVAAWMEREARKDWPPTRLAEIVTGLANCVAAERDADMIESRGPTA